jgi:hypothetical protein
VKGEVFEDVFDQLHGHVGEGFDHAGDPLGGRKVSHCGVGAKCPPRTNYRQWKRCLFWNELGLLLVVRDLRLRCTAKLTRGMLWAREKGRLRREGEVIKTMLLGRQSCQANIARSRTFFASSQGDGQSKGSSNLGKAVIYTIFDSPTIGFFHYLTAQPQLTRPTVDQR